MKKLVTGILSLLLLAVIPPSFAIQKLKVSVEIAESHPFLPGYEFGTSGTLGDVWGLDVEVLDADGDPAEGSIVRIYLGKKSVGTGRVGFNGVAKVKLNLNKLGVQTFKLVAVDDDPSSKGESTFKLKVNEPKVVRIFSPTKVCQENRCETKLRPNPQLIMDAGCNDSHRYWTSYTIEARRCFPGSRFCSSCHMALHYDKEKRTVVCLLVRVNGFSFCAVDHRSRDGAGRR